VERSECANRLGPVPSALRFMTRTDLKLRWYQPMIGGDVKWYLKKETR
jgi:hypothetical protein